MNKKELMEEVNFYTEETFGEYINFKSLSYIILKTLELKEKGLKSEHYEEKRLNLKEK